MPDVRRFACVLFLGSVLLAGCGTDDPTDLEDFSPPADMVGTWIFQSATENGAPTTLALAMEWSPGTVESRLHVEANGAFVVEDVDAAGGQLWFESGFLIVNVETNEVEMNVQLDSDGPSSEVVPLTFTLGGGVLTLELIEGGTTLVFTLGM
jgi:hypothetical protein